jgi:uncharacterized protein with PIN domain
VIVLGTSAVLAIAFLEPEARRFAELVHAARQPLISAASFVEASILIQSRRRSPSPRHLGACPRIRFRLDNEVLW